MSDTASTPEGQTPDRSGASSPPSPDPAPPGGSGTPTAPSRPTAESAGQSPAPDGPTSEGADPDGPASGGADPDGPASGGAPRKPKIGDTMPAPPGAAGGATGSPADQQPGGGGSSSRNRRRRRRGRGGGGSGGGGQQGSSPQGGASKNGGAAKQGGEQKQRNKQRSGSGRSGQGSRGARGPAPTPVEAVLTDESPLELDESTMKRRGGRSRKGRAVGRYQMNVHVHGDATQIAVLEGRSLVEHYVSRPTDDVNQIHGNIYVGKVENVLPGMEAAFVDIAHAQERRALPRRRAVRPRRHRVQGRPTAPHRGGPAGHAADPVPGHEEPDRAQGRPAHPGGVAARPLRGAGAQLEHVRHLQAPARRRTQAAAQDPRPGQARTSTASSCAPPPRASPPEEIERDVAPAGQAVGPDRGAGVEAAARRRCSTASPRWRCGSSARSSTRSTARWSSTTQRCTTRSTSYVAAVAPALAERVQYYDPRAEPLPLFERYHVHRAAREGARPQGLAALGRLAHHRGTPRR